MDKVRQHSLTRNKSGISETSRPATIFPTAIVQPGVNLIKLLQLYFTSVAIVQESKNNSYTCKSLIKFTLYRAKACSSQAIYFQQLVCDSQLQYNTVNFSPMCSLYGGQRRALTLETHQANSDSKETRGFSAIHSWKLL